MAIRALTLARGPQLDHADQGTRPVANAPVLCPQGQKTAELSMRQYLLAEIYSNLRRDVRIGDISAASGWLNAALGLTLAPPPAAAILHALQHGMNGDLTFRGFKPAELAMIAGNLKGVVKLEDIPLPNAKRFVARHGQHYNIWQSEIFVKDYLLLRSKSPDGSGEPLVNLYVGRDDRALALQQLELSDRENAAACGALLGFPPCCTKAFAADFARSRQDQDTLNDDACARVLATASLDKPGHPALNPLSHLELIGFYPCSLRCRAATAAARRTARALAVERPALVPELKLRLQRAVLFWRMPFFVTFDRSSLIDGLLCYHGARVNAFADPIVRRVQALFAAQILPKLALGDALRLGPGAIEIYANRVKVTEIETLSERPPVLSRWGQWPKNFF